jgi:hypothetical protein
VTGLGLIPARQLRLNLNFLLQAEQITAVPTAMAL